MHWSSERERDASVASGGGRRMRLRQTPQETGGGAARRT